MRSFTTSKGDPPLWVKFLTERAGILSLLCLVASVGYTLYAITPDASENTRISENALLPGVVDESFDSREKISTFLKDLRTRFKEGLVRKYVKERLRSFGIEVYTQEFDFHQGHDRSKNETGQNVYGIVRAYRSAPVEAILVVVPLKESHIDSVALAMALQTFCREQVYWSRDIIFLYTDRDEIGLEAWLAAYHGYKHPYIHTNSLEAHGGSIIGATVLDIVGSRFNHVNLQFNMVNGKLPNLDLFNVYVRLAEKFQLRTCIYGMCRQHTYEHIWKAFLKGIFTQAFYEVEGLHSVFGGYSINAITLQAHERKKSSENGTPLWRIGQIVEGGLRSINNILEKFHQSYFLYILTTPRKFLSVAYYMPIVGLAAAPMLFYALREWFNAKGLEIPSSFLPAHLFSLFIYLIGVSQYPVWVQESIQINDRGLQVILAMLLQSPLMLLFRINSPSDWTISKFFLYLEVALFIGALSLINFSLGLVIAVCMVPTVLLFTTTFPTSTTMSTLKKLLIFFAHPLVFVFMFHVISQLQANPKDDLTQVFLLSGRKVVSNMNVLIHRHLIHSSITFPVLSIFVSSIYYYSLLIVYY